VFGGNTLYGATNRVLSYDLSSGAWSFLATSLTGPSARYDVVSAYDPVRDRLLVFSGFGSGYMSDLWQLTLSGNPTWSQLFPTGTPPSPRGLYSFTYDPLNDRMILFGGSMGGTDYRDVWALKLAAPAAWTQLFPTGTPPSPRSGHSAIYDTPRDRLIVFGGNGGTALNDVWALSLPSGGGTPSWSQISPSGSPPSPRYGHTAVAFEVARSMLVFGGSAGGSPLGDLWSLNLNTSAWSQIVPNLDPQVGAP